jgi:bifunctional DNA-binding transcriptional regulator/antitoxin component of YhaV-PrlF toxin-antitoxin module
MTVTVKNKDPLVVPRAVSRKAGLKRGQELEFRVSGGIITILPKSQPADKEYTPAQRRAVDSRLAEGLADIKAGRTYGPFNTADEMIAHMKAPLKKRAIVKRAKRSR